MTHDADIASEIWYRPDGTDADVYKALAAEGRHRLAWEWLIRNAVFQRQCHAVRIGFVDANWVAATWGMYRFKPFYEPYSTQRKPRFLVSKVRLFRAKNGQLVRHVGMRKDEMAFVFDVKRMVRSLDSRDAQIATMTRLLDAAIDRRRQRKEITPEPISRATVANIDTCLQVADLLHRDIPASEIKRQVQYLRATTDANSAHGRFRDLQDRTQALVYEGGYLGLANRAHSKGKGE